MFSINFPFQCWCQTGRKMSKSKLRIIEVSSQSRVHSLPANWSLLFICRAFKAIPRSSASVWPSFCPLCFSLMFTIIIKSCTELGARKKQRYCDINFSFQFFSFRFEVSAENTKHVLSMWNAENVLTSPKLFFVAFSLRSARRWFIDGHTLSA